jgi:hypothetical protein
MQVESDADHSTRRTSLWAKGERALTVGRGTVALAAIVLLSLVFRVHMSQHASLWLDEVTTHLGVLMPWPKVLSGPSRAHPPLMYVLVKLAIKPFGDGETGLRSVSLFFGCVLLAAIFELCRELGLSIQRSLVVVATFALTPFFIRHATEARHYALLASFATLATTRALRLLRGQQSTADLLVFAACVVAMPATHYFGLAYAAALLGSVIFGVGLGWRHRSRQARQAVVGALLVCLVPLGYITQRAVKAGEFFGVGKGGGGAFPFNSELLREIPHEFSFFQTKAWQLALEPALALVGLVLLSRRLRGVARLLPLGLGVAPCVAALFVSAEHFMAPRYLSPSAVLYHLGACVALFAAVDGVRNARGAVVPSFAPYLGGLTFVGVLAMRLAEYPDGFGAGGDDYRGLQSYFNANLAKDTEVVAYPGLFGDLILRQEYGLDKKPIRLEKFEAVRGSDRYLIVEIHCDTAERREELETLIEQTFGLSAPAYRALPLVPLPHSIFQPAVAARIVQVPTRRWSPKKPAKRVPPALASPKAAQGARRDSE